jgi:Fic family protein
MLKTEAVSQYISQRSIKPFFLDEQSKYRTFGKKYKKAMEQSIWQEIGQLYQKFQELGISEAVDYEKYYLYSLITHSTAIEGSTLTEAEAQMLFDEGLTAKGKPLVYHLMNEDLKKAYELAKAEARNKTSVTPAFLRKLNAALMRTTGSVYNVMGGSFDSSKGEFRLCGITAGIGGRSYMNYQKVPAKVDRLCAILQEKQSTSGTFREQYELSFNAHLNLATIHPWVDGNGRTARLLMNYIQFCRNLFPTKIFREDREEYILSSLTRRRKKPTNRSWISWHPN